MFLQRSNARVAVWRKIVSGRLAAHRSLATAPKMDTGGKLRFLDSHGDYRSDALQLEDPSQKLYANQKDLPRLPVPSLEETMETFLTTALPFCKSEDERDALIQAASRFPRQAAHLQERLLQRQQADNDSSWLQKWWNQLGYLQVRTSNVIHVSYCFSLADDPTATSMTNRAAAILQTATLFAKTIQDGGSRDADVIRNRKTKSSIPLCSSQYKYLFSSSRVPRSRQDSYRIYYNNPQQQQQQQQHAVVAHRGQFYRIPITDKTGKVLSRRILESMLLELVEPQPPATHSPCTAPTTLPELGWLTATNRDSWAKTYEAMQTMSPSLSDALEELQSGLLLLCLDDNDEENDNNDPDRSIGLRHWHGNGIHTANRWFDKSVQLIVSDRPAKYPLGYVGEHSMADGMPTLGLCQALVTDGACDQQDPVSDVADDSSFQVEPIFELAFSQLSSSDQRILEDRVETARQEVLGNIARHDLQVQRFTDYGRQKIKGAGYSPDAFCQMALQLAARRVFGKTVGTYESTHTRQFLHGRTETTRSVSVASQAFCNAMVTDSCSSSSSSGMEETRELLIRAVDAHVIYTRKALAGRGVDRHFFGLSLLLEDGEDIPDLMQHPIYAESKRWRMSTSTLPNTTPGFGNVEPDGVGIGYDILKDHCIFTVTAEKETGYALAMKHEIGRSLTDMAMFLESSEPLQSKI